MRDLQASEIMVRPVVSARMNASVRDVALQLLTGLYSGMPVTDDHGKVVGVITEMDILKALMNDQELVRITAEDIMNKLPIMVDQDAPVSDIIRIMMERNIIRVPVVDAEMKLVGIVSRCDILKAQIEPEFATNM